jgi:D-sedoheptulose 7-phosphate isomerase
MYLTKDELLQRMIAEHPELSVCVPDLRKLFEIIHTSYDIGGKLLLCGNGGSAADCDHIAGELMKGFLLKRPAPAAFAEDPALAGEGALLQGALPAIPLTGSSALATAVANDVAPDMIFAQQVYGYGRCGDVLLGISTSGNAKNVCRALRVARALNIRTLGLTGRAGGAMKALCDVCLCAPADATYRVQEYHLPLYHTLCAMLEATYFSE